MNDKTFWNIMALFWWFWYLIHDIPQPGEATIGIVLYVLGWALWLFTLIVSFMTWHKNKS